MAMSYGVTLLNFQNGKQDAMSRDTIIGILLRHGCKVPELREGSNEIGLPKGETAFSLIGEFMVLAVKYGELRDIGLERPQGTRECKALLFSLINEAGLAMIPDYGTDIFAREDVFKEIPQNMLAQFSNRIAVNHPEDCAW
jgi:hypothetical protein